MKSSLKKISLLMLVLVLVLGLSACGQKNNESAPAEKPAEKPAESTPAEKPAEKPEEPASKFDAENEITVITREEGSGTRGAFVEITGVLSKDANGEEVDNTTVEAIVQNSTNNAMTGVNGDEFGIAYISLGSLNDTVKALKVESVEATAENVKSGEYKLARPFNIAYKEDNIGEIGEDLLKFIMSEEGQKIVEEKGYVSKGNEGKYEPSGLKGQITVAGSTSVTPLMEKIVEAYNVYNPDVQVDIQATGSSAGMTSAMEGTANLGMASRELKDKEAAVLKSEVIAIDGIAVIVNNENPCEDLSMDKIRQIFVGEITEWSEVIK